MRRIRSRKLRTALNLIKIAILLVIAGALGILAATFYTISKVLPSPGELEVYVPAEATRIFSSEGKLLATVYEENRQSIPITQMPKYLQDATVAIEDSRFYTHSGVDPKGILRAVYENLRRGSFMQGGSTLTQQLARNIYLSQRKTVSRKLQEMLLAREIERRLSKEEILERYLNLVYYGSGAYGVKAAARTYFGKQPAELTLAECALLAGLPKKPSGWSPYDNKKAAIGRRNVVLARMAELGYITRAQAEEASREEVRLVGLQYGRARVKRAPHFVDYVVKQLVEKWGPDEVYRGGLRVVTTLNLEMQAAAERALRRQVDLARRQGKRVGQGAMVAIDPRTGHIKVMVGSLDYYDKKNDGMWNNVVQAKRQPGSAFKPFVYTAAIDNGYSPNYILMDTPVSFPDGNKVWSPGNYDNRFRGPVTMRRAVEMSINVPAIRMAQQVGIDKVIAYAQRMGIKSQLKRNLSLAIGTSEVSPLELAAAYGPFATGGIRAEPMAIVKVIGRDDKVLEDNRPQLARVIPYETATTMADILRGVVTRGTARRAAVIEGAHGKTGTTQNLRDAWFIGFTRDLVAAVWVGNNDYSPMGSAVFGGTVCAPAWVEMMQTAVAVIARARKGRGNVEVARQEPERPSRPREDRRQIRDAIRQGTVFREICLQSEMLATPACPQRAKAGFPRGSEPTEYCVIHASTTRPVGALESPQSGTGSTETPPGALDSGADRSDSGEGAAASGQASARVEEVTICTKSQRRATEYCPEVVIKKLPESQIPGACTLHTATSWEDGAAQ